ncbi:hypothetical protein SEMRO_116_G057090.1 [Seminavis robusta]|uniref:Uncharacterized protein n=1 Tax=Seminavis robusta TaxID=568900 RepID=A0A9N8H5J7_9STRA|nr:hypothetical protein SEMRO_116_G057090.1 [Seminavis robusta]|eukprot:Sro116_g057090.1 n/a (380) ;mRNA; r:59885-61354
MPSLSDETKAKLFKDIEENKSSTCDDIVKLRPELYGGQFRSPTRNRYHYLQRMKKEKPQDYYKQYAQAQKALITNTFPDQQKEEEPQLESLDPTEDSPSKLQSLWGTEADTDTGKFGEDATEPTKEIQDQRVTRSATAKKSKTKKKKSPPAQEVDPSRRIPPPIKRSTNKKMTEQTGPTGTPVRKNKPKIPVGMKSPAAAISSNLFTSFDDAYEQTDYQVSLNTDYPESHVRNIACTSDMISAQPMAPAKDQRVQFRLREVSVSTKQPGGGPLMTQLHIPGFFDLRVVEERPRMLNAMEEEEHTLANAFAGCSIKRVPVVPSKQTRVQATMNGYSGLGASMHRALTPPAAAAVCPAAGSLLNSLHSSAEQLTAESSAES